MLRNKLLLRLVSAMAIGLAVLNAPGFSLAASPVSLPPAGMGSVVLVNQDTGPNETLNVNFAGSIYTIAPRGSTASNQVQFNIPPGTYSYTAGVAGIGSVNGTLTVPADRVLSLAFVDNAADLANGDQNADDQPVVVQTVTADNDDENAEGDRESKADEESEESKGHEAAETTADGDETATPVATNTPAPTETATPAPTSTGTPAPTATATPEATSTGTPAPTATATPAPTSTPEATVSGATSTPEPGETATPAPTSTPKEREDHSPAPTATAVRTPETGETAATPRPTVAKPKSTPKAGDDAATPKPTINSEKTTTSSTKADPVKTKVITNNSTTDNNNHSNNTDNTKSSSGSSSNSGSGTLNACPNPNLAICAGTGGSSDLAKPKGKKKSDVVTISFAPGDHVTAATPADGGHDKDDDDDDESSEQTVTNVVVPAVDNDELLVTVTDITSQAQ